MTTSFDLGSLVKLQVNAAAEFIHDLVDPSANLIFGAVIDQSLTGQVSLEELEISRVICMMILRVGLRTGVVFSHCGTVIWTTCGVLPPKGLFLE